jgi:F-box-like
MLGWASLAAAPPRSLIGGGPWTPTESPVNTPTPHERLKESERAKEERARQCEEICGRFDALMLSPVAPQDGPALEADVCAGDRNLPEEVLVTIMQYLSMEDLAALAGTCRRFYSRLSSRTALGSVFWRERLTQDFPTSPIVNVLSSPSRDGSPSSISPTFSHHLRGNWKQIYFREFFLRRGESETPAASPRQALEPRRLSAAFRADASESSLLNIELVDFGRPSAVLDNAAAAPAATNNKRAAPDPEPRPPMASLGANKPTKAERLARKQRQKAILASKKRLRR